MRIKKSGFTLIELMVATAIIAILAALIVAALGQNRVRARDVNRKQSLTELSLSLEQQFATTKTYFVEMPGSGAECQAQGPGAYSSTQDMYMASVPGSDTSRCVGYKNGGAGLVNAKNNINPSYPAVNSIADALYQAGYLAKEPLDPLVNDFSQVISSGRDFLLTLCNSQGLPATTPADATEYGLYAKLEQTSYLTTAEQDSTVHSCGAPNSPGAFDIDIAAEKQ